VQQLTLYDIVLARHEFVAAPFCTASASRRRLVLISLAARAGSPCTSPTALRPTALHVADAVESVFRCDAVTASFFASASTLLCCSRQRAADVTARTAPACCPTRADRSSHSS